MNSALNPRKLPRQARALATRASILEGATQVLSARGLAGFSTSAVAERAGVSIGSLYQYFGNKDALMAAVIHAAQARQVENVAAAAQALVDADLEQVVRLMVRGAMQHHREDALLATAIDHEEARLAPSLDLEPYLARSRGLVLDLLDRYAHQLRPLDRNRAARTLPHIVRAVSDAWSNLDPPELHAAEDEAVRAVLGYLRG
jgi:AcrR family transcriptional regulator